MTRSDGKLARPLTIAGRLWRQAIFRHTPPLAYYARGGRGDANPALTLPDKTAYHSHAAARRGQVCRAKFTREGTCPVALRARLCTAFRLARRALPRPCRAFPYRQLASLQNAVANGDTRTLSLHHTHPEDDITVTFKRNGRYDEAGLKKLNYFLRDWRNDEQIKMDPQLFDIVWEVQREVGAKETIHIISAYRSPETNAMLRRRCRGVAQFSQHMLGKAIDFNIPDVPLEQIRAAGLRLQRGGVGFYPGSFVHLDVGSVRHWPRMTHDQFARVFPNGRTVHVPPTAVRSPATRSRSPTSSGAASAPSRVSLAYARDAGVIGADESASLAAKPKGSPGPPVRLLDRRGEDDDARPPQAGAPRRGGRREARCRSARAAPAG